MNGHPRPPGSREKEIFLSAIEKTSPEEQAAYVHTACGDDQPLRAAVEELLRHHRADAFLEQPATLIESSAEAQRRQREAARSPFAPGELFGDRYRIVGFLGEGGMGKVYRADDLKLGQSVALKFLPPALAIDPVWLLRFRNEVRIAREVAHPNVCRVYDIGEAEGEHFISMEFVDGEDLTSLLRRIGRLPQDKAVEIARQLCAGLAAAHARGVIHRDLKPANIMVDGRGKVRITDFGIAALAEQVQGKEVRAGTPSYMAPEQLAGTEVTLRSDIYALGLVLYEIFTGKKAIDGTSITQVERAQSRGAPPTPASHVRDLDPQVERIILRCLEPEPKNRPRSAMAVAAALPGTDLLAEAIAAGDTPSPELLAEAGESGSLRPWVAISLLTVVVVGMVCVVALKDRISLLRLIPSPKPPEVLADRAEQIAQRLGHTNALADRAHWYSVQREVLSYLERKPASDRRRLFVSGHPPTMVFSYRSAPEKMEPQEVHGRVDWGMNPPFVEPGMKRIRLDTEGRLLEFEVVPARYHERSFPTEEPDWSMLFVEAGLDMNQFSRTVGVWTPSVYCEVKVAWSGASTNWPREPLRVEAGSFAGKPVFFQVIGPWQKPPTHKPKPSPGESVLRSILDNIFEILGILVLVLGTYAARRNLLAGRADRAGARRLGILVFIAFLVEAVLAAHTWDWGFVTNVAAIRALGAAFLTAFCYLGIEPYARRHWPHTLISWSRLWAGRFHDPGIGRDVLVGCLAGLGFVMLGTFLYNGAAIWNTNVPAQLDVPGRLSILLGERHAVAHMLVWIGRVGLLLGMFLFLLLLRTAFKRAGTGILAFITLMLAMLVHGTGGLAASWSDWIGSLLYVAIIAFVTIRFGLLALIVMLICNAWILQSPATLDFSAWWAVPANTGPIAALVLAVWGCWISLAGKPLFKDEMLANQSS